MKHALLVIVTATILSACNNPEPALIPESSFPLKTYVETADPAFRYEIKETIRGESWTEYRVYLVSGTWLTEKEVDEPQWWHWLTIVVPDKVRETESLMLIGGGSRGETEPIPANEEMIRAALVTGSVVSHISNIPFQPIDYKNDTAKGVYEDDLIAFAWMQFIEGGASEDLQKWLPRFPMTRAVVKAMDVVQEICEFNQSQVEEFFVAGASKRGWTTWDVAAVDERVTGIAPVVIDLLNIIPSFQHHWQCYGEWAPAIDPYANLGVMNYLDSDEFFALLKLVEPYQFLERLTMPKLLINAISKDTIYAEIDPESEYQIRIWEAINKSSRDFKSYVVGDEAWQMDALEISEDGSYAIPVSVPESGYKGALVEVVFNPDSDFPLTLTTGTLVTPDSYPFDPFTPN